MNAKESMSYDKLLDEKNYFQSVTQTLGDEITVLKEQVSWFKRQIFGKRSEKISPSDKDQLILKGFEFLRELPVEADKIVKEHKRKKPKRKGQDAITIPEDLPIETTILDIPESEKVCKETGVNLVKIGDEKSHKLAHKPGSYYIKETIRPKYAHPQKEENGILTADLPDSLIPKCRADESLLASIITKKYGDHLPLYRIEEIMGREGIKISRKLLSQWVLRCASGLKPLYDEMLKKVLSGKEVFIDEVPVKLQKKVKCKQSYLWVVVGGGEGEKNPPYRIYEFKEDRRHQHAFDILGKYSGGLHSDKYEAYQKLAKKGQVEWYPCYAHIRRKFFEVECGDLDLCKWILRKIRHLYMLDRVAWSRSPKERLRIRQEKAIPIIDELIKTIQERQEDGKILPKSKLRKALTYTFGLIPYLKNYTKNANAHLDNNVAERSVRPIAIGRKNWLFFGSSSGGEAAGILFSLVQTCRSLGINPREYLEDVMRRIMSHNSQKLYELLPDQWLKSQKNTSPP